jgi:hypothetical protein
MREGSVYEIARPISRDNLFIEHGARIKGRVQQSGPARKPPMRCGDRARQCVGGIFDLLLNRSVMIRRNAASGSSCDAFCIAVERCLHPRAVIGHDVAAGGGGEISASALTVDFQDQVIHGAAFPAGNIVERLSGDPIQAGAVPVSGSPNAAFLKGFHAECPWNVQTYPK